MLTRYYFYLATIMVRQEMMANVLLKFSDGYSSENYIEIYL